MMTCDSSSAGVAVKKQTHTKKTNLPSLFFQVPEIIQLIYYYVDSVTEEVAQDVIKKVFQLLVQSHTDEVILTLFKIEDRSLRLPIPSATNLQATSCPFISILVCACSCSSVFTRVCRFIHTCVEARDDVRCLP